MASYYKSIKGKKYDGKMIDLADRSVSGKGDGRISLGDAKKILATVKDSDDYTDVEKNTMRYIRDHYKFTAEADRWFRTEIRKWAAAKAGIKVAKKPTVKSGAKSKPKPKPKPKSKPKPKPKAKPRPKLKPKPIPKPKPKAKPKSKTPVKKAPQKQAFFPAPAVQESRVSYPVKKEKSGRSPVKVVVILLVLALIAFLGYRFFPEIKGAFQKFSKAPETAGVKEAVPEKPAEVAGEKKTVEEKPVVEQKPARVEDESGYYVVQPKDSLVSISESISGKYDDWKKLFENNKDRIKSPTLIYPGQKLKVSGIEKSEKK